MTENQRKRLQRERIRKKNRKRAIRNKLLFMIFAIISGLSFVGIYRVVYIKAEKGDEYEQKAIENQINKVQDKIINPNRGTILDRNNQAIAISTTVYNIALDLRNISKEKVETQQKLMQILSEELEIDNKTLMDYLAKDEDGTLKDENDTHWKIIKKKVPYDKGKSLEARLSDEKLRGVYLEEDSQREYPHKSLAAHMVGFIMGDSSWGLESYYNSEMTGTPGRIYRTYEMNNSIVTRDVEPIKGNDIVTTIDLTIQQFAEDIVEKTYLDAVPEHTPVSTSITVINPKTGEIIAMAQYPTYDLNNPLNISLLENPDYKSNFEKLSEEEQIKERNSIWKNFTISDSFEPGSTFKPMVVAAALEEGVITMDDTFYCEGYRIIGGQRIRCHNRSGHGLVNVEEALAQSCNMAMIDIVNKLGKEKFYKYQKDFGFGEKTGIDLYGEVDVANLVYPLERLNIVELATSSFGQGFNSTPLQTIMAFASTINGGNLMKPYIVSQVINQKGEVVKENKPQVIRKVISQETSDILRESMISTVSPIGTGSKAVIDGYSLAGKTGTAQQGKREDNIYTLSFAAYLPAEDPQYLALAVIHKPKDYSNGVISPSPMIKDLFLKIIDYKAIPPSNPNTVSEEVMSEIDEVVLKDYTNKSLKETINDLNKIGLDYQIVGSSGDTVVKHFPVGNTKISKKGEVLLYVDTVNKEKELQVVPDTLNLSIEESKAILENIGFEVFIEENEITEDGIKNKKLVENPIEDVGTIEENEEQQVENTSINQTTSKKVYEQMPQSGVYIEKGSTIKLKVK